MSWIVSDVGDGGISPNPDFTRVINYHGGYHMKREKAKAKKEKARSARHVEKKENGRAQRHARLFFFDKPVVTRPQPRCGFCR